MKVMNDDEIVRELAGAHIRCVEGKCSSMPYVFIVVRHHHNHQEERTSVQAQDANCLECEFYVSDDYDRLEEMYHRESFVHMVRAIVQSSTSGDPFSKKIHGGIEELQELLEQKYRDIESSFRSQAKQDPAGKKVETETTADGKQHNNSGTTGTAAAAAAGSAAAVGGTAVGTWLMGYTATGITANSVAASIMSMEAVAGGGGVAAGGFTATMQTIGAVGVMASPVGWAVAATGAVGGAGAAWYLSRNKSDRTEPQDRDQAASEISNK